jgi:membrane protein
VEELKNNVIPLYFLGMNGLLFVLMGFDKLCAVKRKWRVPEKTFLGLVYLVEALVGFLG